MTFRDLILKTMVSRGISHDKAVSLTFASISQQMPVEGALTTVEIPADDLARVTQDVERCFDLANTMSNGDIAQINKRWSRIIARQAVNS